MKKKILTILLFGVMVISIIGCGNYKDTENLKNTYDKVNEYFLDEFADRTNLGSLYLDEKNNIVVVALIDNSKEKQEEFVKNANVNSKYIKFEQGGPYTTSGINLYISKPDVHNDIRFNEYYKNNDRTIYLAGNVDEFYVIDNGSKMTLKNYISNANQTFEKSIQSIIEKLELKETLKDGGTKIYKAKDIDITIVVCNTTKNDKNILIGDYAMEYVQGDCKN